MNKLWKIFIVVVALIPAVTFAAHSEEGHAPEKGLTKEEARTKNTEYVKHHTLDSHDFGLFTNEETGTHIGFPLPVILWEDGLHFFMSSSFHPEEGNEHGVAESNGKYFVIGHHDGQIYSCDEHGAILEDVSKDEEGNEVTSEIKPIDFSITKNVFSTLLICLLLFFLFKGVAKSYRSGLAPTGAAKFFEPIVLFIRDEIAIPNIGEHAYKKYMNYLLTVFFFIWFLNLAGMTPLGINVTGNIAVTAGLAIFTFIITNFSAKKDYWTHIFWMPGVPIPMKIMLIPIELVGLIVKPFALMIRLYANMLAGHIVLGSLIAVVVYFDSYMAKTAFIGLTFFMNIIELLVAALQAYIFTMLTALYFGSAASEHAHEEAH
jgi:F-type H+-transporting ATPase subunit a